MGAACCNASDSEGVEGVPSADGTNVFFSLQLTSSIDKICVEWIGSSAFSGASMKASVPPFNNPRKIKLPSAMTAIDVPVFGPKIPKAVMAVFTDPEISEVAKDFNWTIPQNSLNVVVQSKMDTVHHLIKAAREEPTIATSQKHAIDKVEAFVEAFELLAPADIPDMTAWDAFLGSHFESGWDTRLHFDHLLGNFGFDREAAQQLRKMEYVWPDGERMPFEQHAFRWLSKAFTAYGLPGPVTDLVNLIVAMMTSKPNSQMDESRVLDTIGAFNERVVAKRFDDLWIPTHFCMDAETDDSLCWLLLEHIHRTRGSNLNVLVYMPPGPRLDGLAGNLVMASGCKIIEDPMTPSEQMNELPSTPGGELTAAAGDRQSARSRPSSTKRKCWVELSSERPSVFFSLQLTRASDISRAILGKTLLKHSVKASVPPFNNPEKIELPSHIVTFDVPVFGPSIPRAAMKLFAEPEILDLAEQLSLAIPQNRLNAFVQGKMCKVRDLILAARGEPTLATSHKCAIDKMEEFVNAFVALTPADITDMAAWDAFLGKYFESGWETRLHFDHLLGNFGFDCEAAQKLRKMEYVWPDGEKVPYELHALRWLSKAFAAYGLPGPVTDLVNLIFAMMSSPGHASQMDEAAVVGTVEAFNEKVIAKQFDGLWIPSHFCMDAEADDSLCWLLLEHIHRSRGSKLNVLVQLPTDSALDALASDLSKAGGCMIVRDPDSRNSNAIKKYWIHD